MADGGSTGKELVTIYQSGQAHMLAQDRVSLDAIGRLSGSGQYFLTFSGCP